MRTINKSIDVIQTLSTQVIAVSEEFVTIIEDKNAKLIRATINYNDANAKLIKCETFEITGNNYTLLMSANPTFAPNKPQNEYREDDLWYIIDKIRTAN